MWPEVHHVWGLGFTAYDLMRALAILASLSVCAVLNNRQGIPIRKTLLIAFLCIPIALAAARLLNAFEYGANWSNLGTEFLRNSGSSIYGALIVCILMVIALTRVLGISAIQFFDAGAPAIAAGEAVSRVGCFCAGCCYGETWNGVWAVVFPAGSFAYEDQHRRGLLDNGASHSLAVHPVQVYGVILMGLLTWLLIRRFRQPHRPGAIFFLMLVGYGAYRLAIIPLRVEALDTMKLFSVAFVLVGLIGLAWLARPQVAT